MPSVPILPMNVWPSQITQASVPANDNALRAEAIARAAISIESVQPGSPSDGDLYILGPSPSGDQWSTFSENDVAIFYDGTWYGFEPFAGWIKVNTVMNNVLIFDGTSWQISNITY